LIDKTKRLNYLQYGGINDLGFWSKGLLFRNLLIFRRFIRSFYILVGWDGNWVNKLLGLDCFRFRRCLWIGCLYWGFSIFLVSLFLVLFLLGSLSLNLFLLLLSLSLSLLPFFSLFFLSSQPLFFFSFFSLFFLSC
jgi:hypothetical protein